MRSRTALRAELLDTALPLNKAATVARTSLPHLLALLQATASSKVVTANSKDTHLSNSKVDTVLPSSSRAATLLNSMGSNRDMEPLSPLATKQFTRSCLKAVGRKSQLGY